MAAPHVADLKGLARSSTLNLVGGGATAVLTLALMLVFTRSLGTAAAGVLFSAIALFQVVAAVAGLGVETGAVRFITARNSNAAIGVDDGSLRRIALIPVAIAGVLTAIAMFATADAVGGSVGGDTHGAEAAEALRTMALFLPVAALGSALLGATRGYATMLPTVVVDRIGRPLVQLATVAVAVAVDAPMATVALLWAGAFLLQMVAAWWWLARLESADPQPGRNRPLREARREFWGFTIPRAAATTLRTTLQWFDVVLVAALASPEGAAVYAVATRLLQLGLLAAFSVGQAAEPLFGGAVAVDDSDRTRRLYQVSTAWLILVTWPFYILLSLFAPAVLSIFGDGFQGGVPVVLILVVSVLFGAAVGPADILLVMKGKSTWSLWNTAASLATNLALNIWLIPILGISGAALAWTASRIIGNLLPVVQLARTADLHPFGGGWVIAAGASVVTFGVLGAGSRAVFGTTLITAVGVGLAALLVFALVIRRFRESLAIDLALSSLRRQLS